MTKFPEIAALPFEKALAGNRLVRDRQNGQRARPVRT